MKKPLIYVVVAVLFLAGISLGLIAANYLQGTYALEEETLPPVQAPDNKTSQEKPDPEEPTENTKPKEEKPASERESEKEPEKEDDKTNVSLPEEPPGEVLSWWFKRNSDHKAPYVDPVYSRMLAGKGYYLGDINEKTVYLTFDEGYENGNTARILDILKANGVQAAFFVTGQYIDDEPELVKRMVAEGHIVGNHTETHPSLPEVSNEQMKKELVLVEEKFRNLTGQSMKYLRPPMGEYNNRTLKTAKLLGYDSIFWSMAYRDWERANQPGKDVAHKHVLDNIHNGAIILLHAVSDSNTEALDDILKDLKSQGYRFGSLDELG